MSRNPTRLAQDWLERLGTGAVVDLADRGASRHPVVEDLLRVYAPRGFSIVPLVGSYLTAGDDGLRLDLTATLLPPGARPDSSGLGIVERHFDTAAGWARHVKLELPPEWRGRGLGRLMARESALLYEDLGVTEVTLNAVEYGRYVWAMCGFDYRDTEERTAILDAVEEFAEDLGLTLEGLATCERPWDIGSMEGRPLTMREIADARGEVIPQGAAAELGDETMLVGKALLLFSDYEGYEGVLRLGEAADAGREQMLIYTDI
jgi:GNAT superfamily N-acetyltransferase